MEIAYDHLVNAHTLQGARAALETLFRERAPMRLLDVGCGRGMWLRAALELGVPAVFGIDGVAIAEDQLLIPRECFRVQDLTEPWSLAERFDTVLCLEVAEHLPLRSAEGLIRCLVHSAETVVFSAAAPGQPGQSHLNCQWPSFWQDLFNRHGFRCDDDVRWQIWTDSRVEPWYRQNIFVATRNSASAGQEERLKAVIHPDMLRFLHAREIALRIQQMRRGSMSLGWYLKAFLRGITFRLVHRPGIRPGVLDSHLTQ